MSESNPSMGAISEDEQCLIRLFRCLDHNARSEMLQRLGKRLMMEAAMDQRLSLYENPTQSARDELQSEIDDRLKEVWPVHCNLLGLLDYDFDVTQEGWQEASISVAKVILGSAENDDEFGQMLVEAYLEGARKYDVPLPIDFIDPEENEEETVQAMREDLQREAVAFIKSWRENVIRRFEQGP